MPLHLWGLRSPLARATFCSAALLFMVFAFAFIPAGRAAWPGSDGPIYTISALRIHLLQAPSHWLDRTLRVWAVPDYCAACGDWLPALADPTPQRGAASLPVVPGPAPRLLAALRMLPVVGRYAPAPQTLVWGRPAVYRIQVRRVACALPLVLSVYCAEAVLVDAAP